MDFAAAVDDIVKIKESKKIGEYLDFCQRAEKAMEHENVKDTICS